MSVDFGVVVAFDGGAALGAATKIADTLGKVETQAKKASDAGQTMSDRIAVGAKKAAANAGALDRAMQFDGPAKKLPAFLRLGGAVQARASQMGEAVGAAAGKLGVMGSAAGLAVGAFQSFAIGGPIGAAIFALTQLSGLVGDLIDGLGSLGESMADTDIGQFAFGLAGIDVSGARDTLAAITEATKKAVEANKILRSGVADLTKANEDYSASLTKLAGMKGSIGIGDIGELVSARNAVQQLREERDALLSRGTTTFTAAETAKFAELTAAIEKNKDVLAQSLDVYTVGADIAKQEIEKQSQAVDQLHIAEAALAQLQSGQMAGSLGDVTRATIAATNAVNTYKAATLTGGDKVLFDAQETLRKQDELMESLTNGLIKARALANETGDSSTVKLIENQISAAQKSAKASLGTGGGLSAYGQFLKSINGPITDLAQNEGFLGRAWTSNAVGVRTYTEALRENAEARARLTGVATDELALQIKITEAFARDQALRDQRLGVTTSIVRDSGTAGSARSFADGPGLDIGAVIPPAVEEASVQIDVVTEKVDTFNSKLSEGFLSAAQQATDVAGAINQAFSTAFTGIEDNLVSLVTTGKADFGALADAILADIARILVRQAMLAAITGGASALGGTAGGGGGLLDSLAGLTGFATGGEGVVSGSGGTDSKVFMARVTPGEDFRFRTPEQRQADERRERANARPVQMTSQVINQFDPRQMVDVLGGGMGRQKQLNNIRLDGRTIARLTRI